MGTFLSQWEQAILKWVLILVFSNYLWPMDVGEGGRVHWALFFSCGQAPLAWPAGPGGAAPLPGEVRGPWELGAALGEIPVGAAVRGGGGSLKWLLTIATSIE